MPHVKKRCEKSPGSATITYRSPSHFYIFHKAPSCESGFWIGAKRNLPSQDYHWRDETRLSWDDSYWSPGEPTFEEKAECVEMRRGTGFEGKLNDHHCNIEKDYICQGNVNLPLVCTFLRNCWQNKHLTQNSFE